MPAIPPDREASKNLYDLFKHLTTLSSGSILLILALLEKLFKESEWRWLIGAAVLLFLVALTASFLSMFYYAGLHAGETPNQFQQRMGSRMVSAAMFSFMFGLFCIAGFIIKNFH